jgi:ankyrin repeat protein
MPPSKKKRGQAARGQPAVSGRLLDAAREGNTAEVVRLLAAGADPNTYRNVAGRNPSEEGVPVTALVVAAMLGYLEMARLLLDGGADPSLAAGSGFTPLIAATGKGHLEVLRLLLARGAPLDAVRDNTTPRDL